VTDNANVSVVIAQITYPNSSSFNITLIDRTLVDYNNTFTPSSTDQSGTYTVTIIANDTANNINSTITTTFTVADNIFPRILNLSPTGIAVNQGTTINITANVTDTDLDTVQANITTPSGQTTTLPLTLNTEDIYNNTYDSTHEIGTYTIIYIANDTSNNINASISVFFVTNDSQPPNISQGNTTVVPASGNQETTYTIHTNATDNANISVVLAQITYPNASSFNITLTNRTTVDYNNTYSPTLTDAPGTYTVQILANDTTDNINSTITTTFTLNDEIFPTLINLTPTALAISQGNLITITANVTDNINVDTITANLTRPSGLSTQITLIQSSTDTYNNTFTDAHEIGPYTIQYIANDSSNNINNTVKIIFITNDSQPPNVTQLATTPGSGNQLTTFRIETNVTDNANVSSVKAQITYPNASSFNITLISRTSVDYNNTYTPSLTDNAGTYTVTIIANDTHKQVNNTVTTTFTLADDIFPTLLNLSPTGIAVNQGTTINITVNATDNNAIDTVLANITQPSGLTTTLTLTSSSTDIYNTTYDSTHEIGEYRILYIANDSSNNINDSISVFFVTNDSQPPNVTQSNTTVIPVSGNQETTYTIHTNVTDNANVSVVIAQITYPNSSSFNLTLINSTATDYNNTHSPASTDAPGTYTVTILANDTNDNINNTITTTFSVGDNIFPTLLNLSPTGIAINQATTVNLTVNVTDNIGIDTVLANVTKPSGLTTTLTLTLSSTDTYNNTYTDTQEIGQYTITYIANDTSNNINDSISVFFVTNDSQPPNISQSNTTVVPAT